MADQRAQLARIAAVAPPPAVRIYTLDNGGQSWPFWLCGRHLAKRKLEGWAVKQDKDPPHADLKCDDRSLFACGVEMVP